MVASSGAKPAVVVVGVDGTDLSMEALTRALELARARSARLVVVNVRNIDAPIADPATGVTAVVMLEEAAESVAEEARAMSEQVLATSDVPWEFITRQGDPAHEIIEVAHEFDADWVVVGATIHGPISGFLLSSVASHLLHHSDVSVAVVRPRRPTG